MDVARLARDHMMGQEAGGGDMLLLLRSSFTSDPMDARCLCTKVLNALLH